MRELSVLPVLFLVATTGVAAEPTAKQYHVGKVVSWRTATITIPGTLYTDSHGHVRGVPVRSGSYLVVRIATAEKEYEFSADPGDDFPVGTEVRFRLAEAKFGRGLIRRKGQAVFIRGSDRKERAYRLVGVFAVASQD